MKFKRMSAEYFKLAAAMRLGGVEPTPDQLASQLAAQAEFAIALAASELVFETPEARLAWEDELTISEVQNLMSAAVSALEAPTSQAKKMQSRRRG